MERNLPRDVTGFDIDTALSRIDGDVDLYLEFLSLFRDHNAGSVEAIRIALSRGDCKAARMETHALKGVAGTIGAIELHEAAARLDAALRTSEIPPGVDELVASLEKAWQTTSSSLAILLDSSGNG